MGCGRSYTGRRGTEGDDFLVVLRSLVDPRCDHGPDAVGTVGASLGHPVAEGGRYRRLLHDQARICFSGNDCRTMHAAFEEIGDRMHNEPVRPAVAIVTPESHEYREHVVLKRHCGERIDVHGGKGWAHAHVFAPGQGEQND
jgi:hypothetical protein